MDKELAVVLEGMLNVNHYVSRTAARNSCNYVAIEAIAETARVIEIAA
jgi:hypothetical protein